MGDRRINRAVIYRWEATKARREAQNMHDPTLRRQVLSVAAAYERMAKMIERLWGGVIERRGRPLLPEAGD
jgi:hypothetical protein